MDIKYSQLKDKINIENLDENPEAISFYHIRQKTRVGFFACFGSNTIKYITWHLRERKQLYQNEIEDDEFIFSDNKQPNSRANAGAFRAIIYNKAEKLGIEKIKPHDFRRTFNTRVTRTGKLLEHQIRSMMGHLNASMGQVYDVSKEVEVLEDYLKIYDVCFNLAFDDVKTQQLERKMIDIELNNQELQKRIEKQDQILSILFGVIKDKIDKDGIDDALEDLFPEKT